MYVKLQRGAHVRVTQHFAQALYVHPVLHAAGGVGVPLRYNYDKPGKP